MGLQKVQSPVHASHLFLEHDSRCVRVADFHFTVCFADSRLGFKIKKMAAEKCVEVSEVLQASIPVQTHDILMSINGDCAEGLSPKDIFAKIKVAQRPLYIRFRRPQSFESADLPSEGVTKIKIRRRPKHAVEISVPVEKQVPMAQGTATQKPSSPERQNKFESAPRQVSPGENLGSAAKSVQEKTSWESEVLQPAEKAAAPACTAQSNLETQTPSIGISRTAAQPFSTQEVRSSTPNTQAGVNASTQEVRSSAPNTQAEVNALPQEVRSSAPSSQAEVNASTQEVRSSAPSSQAEVNASDNRRIYQTFLSAPCSLRALMENKKPGGIPCSVTGPTQV